MNLFKKKSKKRDPIEVFYNIKEELPTELVEKLDWESAFWTPESIWLGLTDFVNKNIQLNSKDTSSVKIYALLCDQSEEEMKKIMERDGY